jgi:hypothetical protein
MWTAFRVGTEVGLLENDKWVKTNDVGRIVGRIHFKEGEYKATKLKFDDEGLGNKSYLGAYVTLDQAKAAVDG